MTIRELLPQNWLPRPQPRTAMPAGAPIPVDYRDRISIITWLFVFALGISLLYTLPTTVITLHALGSPVSIALTKTLVAAIVLALYAAAGVESVISVHPRFAQPARPGGAWPFWALPMAIAIIAVYVLPLAPTRPMQVLVLLASGGLMILALFSLYMTVERGQIGFRRARLVLDALSYGAALVLFLFVYQTRTRSLLSGTLIALTATLLAIELLRSTTDRPLTVLTYGAITGLILGQVTWALNYWWPMSNLTGGLLLLLIFYIIVGIAQHGLQEHLNQRILLEFALFALVALVLIAVVAPRFG
jgi:hypothetical protein